MNTAQQALGQAIQQMQGNREQYLRDMGVSGNSGEGYEVTERTPTALRNKLGLRPGDRIVSLNGQTVKGKRMCNYLSRLVEQGK